MSLDWFPGQKCTLRYPVPMEFAIILALAEVTVPQFGVVYTIKSARACKECGAHIILRELAKKREKCDYPCTWFRPVDSTTMDELRKLLTPEGGFPSKLDEPANKLRVIEEIKK